MSLDKWAICNRDVNLSYKHTMQRTEIANLPLHHGRAHRWLFQRMVKLSRAIALALVEKHGP